MARTAGALILLIGLAGCRPAPGASVPLSPSPASTGGDADAVTALPSNAAVALLLRDRAAAALRHDAQGWLATDDLAEPAYAARERTIAATIAALPLSSFTYSHVGAASRVGGGAVAIIVQRAYAFAGFDTTPRLGAATLHICGSTARPRVCDETPASGAPAPWELSGSVAVVRGTSSLVIGAGPQTHLRAYAEVADRAVAQVTAVWGAGWPRRVVVLAPGTLADASAHLSVDASALNRTAAVTRGELSTTGSATTDDRVVLVPGRFDALTPAGRQAVLTHEVTHVATRAGTRAFPPEWLAEGFADYVGFAAAAVSPTVAAAGLLTDVRAGRLPHALPSDDAFTAPSENTREDAVQSAYEQAWLACRFVAERHGPGTLVAFYRQAADGRSVEAAMVALLHVSMRVFVAQWRAYVQHLAGVTAG